MSALLPAPTAAPLPGTPGNFKPKDEFKYGVRPTNKHAAVALETVRQTWGGDGAVLKGQLGGWRVGLEG